MILFLNNLYLNNSNPPICIRIHRRDTFTIFKFLFCSSFIVLNLQTSSVSAQSSEFKFSSGSEKITLQGNWDFDTSYSVNSILFVNNAKYASFFSIHVESDSIIYWDIPFDHETSCHAGSNQYQVKYYIKKDTLFIQDEIVTIPDFIRACFKINMISDTALLLTRLYTLPSVYNYFKQDIFCGNEASLSEENKSLIQNGNSENLVWCKENDSIILFMEADTLIIITNPDTCNYSLVKIFHSDGPWVQPMIALSAINYYKNFSIYKIIDPPITYLCNSDHYLLLECKLSGLPDKSNKIYFRFYFGRSLAQE